jgi:hypothetical protein
MTTGTVSPLTLSPIAAIRVIKDLAADSNNIVVIRHGKDRQKQRGITRRQIESCLRKGTIMEGPFMNSHGHWQVTLYRHSAGDELHCAVAIEWATRLLVITAY